MIELLLNDPAHDTYTVPVPGQYQVPVYSSSTWYDGVYHTPLGRFRCWISPQLEQCRYRKGRRGNMSPRAFRRRIVRYILQYWLQTCAVPSMNRSVREQSSPLGHHSSCEVTLCASRACKKPHLWGKLLFLLYCYIDCAQLLDVSARYACRGHTHRLPPG